MTKKRGQITVFIIIGLIMLMTYFLLSYYRKESLEEREFIQPELIPVQEFVETCTKGLAREALDIVGINGGYIYFPPRVENDANSYLAMSPIEELKSPYWWYDGRDAAPTLDFIGKQISDYTRERMPDCLRNFSVFGNLYNIIRLGELDVITEIGEEDVAVKTIYPIEVKDKFNKTLAKLQKYTSVIPVRLNKVYNLAKSIMERENKDYFIEKTAIDLISLDDDEIPTIGMEIRCGRKKWLLSKIEDKLKLLLQVNLPYIRIKGTKFNENAPIIPYQLEDTNPFSGSGSYNESYYYYHYIWDVSDIKYPSMYVSFIYDPKWELKLYARPNKGRYLESNAQRGAQIMSIFCLHIWHFTYDVIFPVKATIVDDATEKNERYEFTFAFKAQINHNKPDRTSFSIESFDDRDVYLEEEYCADVTNEITVYAMDKFADETAGYIKGVNLSFTCGRYICDMGKTDNDWRSGGIPVLRKRFPYCSNGIIRGARDDYESSEMFINTGRRLDTLPEERIGDSFMLKMTPLRQLNYTVVKHKMIANGVSGEMPLEGNEVAMVSVKNREEGFQSYSTYSLNETFLEEKVPLKLLGRKSATYDLEVYLLDNQSITGGYISAWGISSAQLRLGRNITFHVVAKDIKDEEEQYFFLSGLKEYSKQVQQPEIR